MNAQAINNMVESMVTAGVPRPQAVAVGMAIQHAHQSPEYATQYGKYLVDELAAFVAAAGGEA